MDDRQQKGHRKDHTGFPGRRCLVQNTKKMDYPATINVVQLMKFPEYKISVNNEKGKREASQQLKQALRDDQSKVKTVELFTAYFHKIEEHRNHPVLGQAADVREPVDPTVELFIERLALAGARKIGEIRRHIRTFVISELFKGVDPPPPTRRRFYPLDKDIWNIIQRTKASTRRSNIDQVNLQSESTSDIKEALQVFKDWNPDWKPSHFMVDFCEAEICALEEVFNDSKTNTNWLTNERLRSWFSTKWLPQAKRWVNVYKTESLKVAINTNNGVERQNKTLKHTFLEGYKNCSLSELLTVVVSDFLPTAYQKYIELNVMFSDGYRKYNTNLPQYLQNRPRAIAQHILDRHFRSLDFKGAVTGREKGVFCVKSLTTSATVPSVHHVPAKTGKDINCPALTLVWYSTQLRVVVGRVSVRPTGKTGCYLLNYIPNRCNHYLLSGCPCLHRGHPQHPCLHGGHPEHPCLHRGHPEHP
ncbi:hypothetical protein JOQ06_027215 [Pogonophryne albipinna]|uniref:Uncharacterized protein n=1 Tax=Pogonophryne albipinna TaxID=1090488 RepID=A0AAD6BDN2_9TELE|nr:hypothetical protein JOQ06_027215 [Pogonophryne albipinna]